MVTYFVSNTDDKDRGWAAPSDDNGKIFTYTMLWACDPQDSTPTYDQVEHFLQFLDKYVSRAIGSHIFLQWSKSVDIGLVEKPFQHTCLYHLQDCVVNGDYLAI
jgi:hypothetical protein